MQIEYRYHVAPKSWFLAAYFLSRLESSYIRENEFLFAYLQAPPKHP